MRVELKDICKTYGRVQASAGVSLTLEPGRIYGLIGENGAGKSTLMRILAGHTRPDSGELLMDGKPAGVLTPALALKMGIGMLYQDPLDFPAMRVWENFSVGLSLGGRSEAVSRLEGVCEEMGYDLPADELVEELTVGERQQLEIARLLSAGARLLILDEPTTGISVTQKEMLFDTARRLVADGDRIVVVVTHKLSDALGLSDEILILRQGRLVGCYQPPYDEREILTGMFGPEALAREAAPQRPPLLNKNGLILEDVNFIGEKFDLENVTLSARPGEIIGLAGLEGNGQSLLLKGLAGLIRQAGGRMNFQGREMRSRNYLDFRAAGIHFLPAARMEQGLFPDLSLAEHVCLAFPEKRNDLPAYFREVCVDRYRLLAAPETCARQLSGGNQQRLLLSLIPPGTRLLLMEHPTRGLDLGSARQVWSHLEELCANGATLFFSSADLDEIMDHSHRVLVFYDRRIIADLSADNTGLEEIGGLMAGRGAA